MTGGPREDDTCRDLVLPALRAAGWSVDEIVEQYPLQNPESEHAMRVAEGRPRRADYVLEVAGVPVAVVEAKRRYASAADGMGQAIDYGRRLDVPFAYATNGAEILLHDRNDGREREVGTFGSPQELWQAFVAGRGLAARTATTSRVPFHRALRSHGGRDVRVPRYYQRVAIQRAVEAIGSGRTRLLLLMATGTGKTFTALQLVHKLREASRQLDGGRTYRVLYLADRDLLVTDPMRDFAQAFGQESMIRLTKNVTTRSRDLYFATYQGLDGDAAGEDDPEVTPTSVFESLPRDFFSLVVVDECHRGSAAPDSRWRGILEHFDAAVQVGLTATPKRDTNIDTYEYFGEPVFEYSLRQGIDDGYLAPYRVRRVVLDIDAFGWEAPEGQVDVHGRPVPAGVYGTRDFERRISFPDRTEAMARRLVGLLRESPGARAVVFCASGQHAYEMKRALLSADPDKTRRDPEWAVRIVGTEPDRVRFVEAMTDPTRDTPQVATTMRLLSTGVDIEDLRFVVLCRTVGSMVEFKQIVGRGTRLYPPKGKQYFEVVDFTGASAGFDDPEFDGPLPAPRTERVTVDGDVVVQEAGADPTGVDVGGEVDDGVVAVGEPEQPFDVEREGEIVADGSGRPPVRILTIEGQRVELLGERLRVVNPQSGRLETLEYRDYVGAAVRSLFPTATALRETWADPVRRGELLEVLGYRGVDLDVLATQARLQDADPFDVLVTVAWDRVPRTRRERAARVREAYGERIEQLASVAREVIDVLLDRYAEHGPSEITPAALQVPPLNDRASVVELVEAFGGRDDLRSWLNDLQRWLYEDSRTA